MNVLKVTLLAGIALFGLANASWADTASGGSITYTGPTDYSAQLGYLSKFNSAAGTLTGVTITVGYGFNSTITVTASTQATGNVSTESAAKFDSSDSAIKAVLDALVNTGGTTVIGSSTLSPTAYDLTGNKSIFTLSAGTSANYDSTKTATNTYSATASELSAFYSTANSLAFDVYGATLTGLNLVVSGGNANATQVTNATQTISILYTYTAAVIPTTTVPEPASLALLGAGLIGLGVVRRKSA